MLVYATTGVADVAIAGGSALSNFTSYAIYLDYTCLQTSKVARREIGINVFKSR